MLIKLAELILTTCSYNLKMRWAAEGIKCWLILIVLRWNNSCYIYWLLHLIFHKLVDPNRGLYINWDFLYQISYIISLERRLQVVQGQGVAGRESTLTNKHYFYCSRWRINMNTADVLSLIISTTFLNYKWEAW